MALAARIVVLSISVIEGYVSYRCAHKILRPNECRRASAYGTL